MAKKKDALATTSDTSIALSAEMLADAKDDVATFAGGSPRISFKGGNISIDKQFVKGNKLPIAIIDTVLAKAYYTTKYEEGVPAVPVCYAFHATDAAALQPHPSAPEKQAATCAACPHNKFGTAEQGKGKRCRDEVRGMGVIPTEADMTGAEARMFTITGNSLKTWNEYLSKLHMMERSARVVVTEIGTEPFGAVFRLTFQRIADLRPEQFAALKARREAAKGEMMRAYPAIEGDEEAKTPPKKRGKEKF